MSRTKLTFKIWDKKKRRFLQGYEEADKHFLGFFNETNNPSHIGIAFGKPDDYFEIIFTEVDEE